MWGIIKFFINCHFIKFLGNVTASTGILSNYFRYVDNEMRDEPSWVEGKRKTLKIFIICTLLICVLAWLCR